MSFLAVHRWLGLLSGLLVFIIAITGSLYAFQEEILDATEDFRFTAERDAAVLPPSRLTAIAQAELPDRHLHSLEYGEPGRAAVALFFEDAPEHYYYLVYLDPYSGVVQGVKDMEAGFFHWVLDGHMYLWLPEEIGRRVVLVATVVFVVMLLTGFVLWLPKKLKQLRQRLTFRWKATTRWKRKNWDLHAIGGVYSLGVALLFAVTGLVYAAPQWAVWYHALAGGEKSMLYVEPPSEVPATAVAPLGDRMDDLFAGYRDVVGTGTTVELHPPATDSSSILIVTNPLPGTYWRSDYVYFDQYSYAERPVDHVYGRYADADAADKLLRLNYDLHVGAALGLPGKILACLASLVIAGLVVTGVLLWWGRRNGPKGRRKPAAAGKPAKRREAAANPVTP